MGASSPCGPQNPVPPFPPTANFLLAGSPAFILWLSFSGTPREQLTLQQMAPMGSARWEGRCPGSYLLARSCNFAAT